MNEKPSKKAKITKNVDKIIMGAIIGGAIGSVVGSQMKAKKGQVPKQKKRTIIQKLFGLNKPPKK